MFQIGVCLSLCDPDEWLILSARPLPPPLHGLVGREKGVTRIK